MNSDPFIRRAHVIRVVDGDTLDVTIDVGFNLTASQRLRLLGVNTPELHAADAAVRALANTAKAFTNEWCVAHLHGQGATWPFLIRTEKSDVFGRYLATVACLQGHELNQALLDAGNPVYKRD